MGSCGVLFSYINRIMVSARKVCTESMGQGDSVPGRYAQKAWVRVARY